MINNNTLRKINKCHFGADVNKIELYIKYFEKVSDIADTRMYSSEYELYRTLLKELKPESSVFSSPNYTDNRLEDKYDFNTEAYFRTDLTYINSKSDIIKNKINFVCIPYIIGINVKCLYINGYVYRIYLCSETDNLYDVTDILDSRIPSYIEEIADKERVELIGKLTIFNNKKESQTYLDNVLCSAMYYIEHNVNIESLDLIFTDIILEDNTELNNIWDRIEFMRTLHINVAHHALIRDIDSTSLGEVLRTFTEYFNKIANETGIIYQYCGLDLRELEDFEYKNDNRFLYNITLEGHKFESKIKSFSNINDNNRVYIIANIVSIKYNNIVIDKVIIDDICKIDDNNLQVGSNIKFKIIDNKAYVI